MPSLRPGMRLRSTACDTEVVVVRAPVEPIVLECGGAPMAALDDVSGVAVRRSVDAAQADGTATGKRYAHDTLDLELLCTKAGDGSLAVGGTPLRMRGAKPLPSSD